MALLILLYSSSELLSSEDGDPVAPDCGGCVSMIDEGKCEGPGASRLLSQLFSCDDTLVSADEVDRISCGLLVATFAKYS